MKKSKGVGLKMAMVLVIIVAIFAVAGVYPAMSERKVEQKEMTFKHGKTVWLLHVYTGEFWWNTI